MDATTNKRLDDEFKTGAHPESFQLETSGSNIYVNLPDLKQIAVINRKTHAISRWTLSLGANFPVALDEPDHRLFIANRAPPRMAMFDTDSGPILATFPCVQDSDDLYYDPTRRRVYVAGGEGYISVFKQNDPDHYQLVAKVSSPLGAHGRLASLEKSERRVLIASTWQLRLAPSAVPKCGYPPSKTDCMASSVPRS